MCIRDSFRGTLPEQLFAPRPGCRFDDAWNPSDIAGFARLIETHRDELAAVILEPVVQGAGGMWFYHPEYLRQVRALCDAHGVLPVSYTHLDGYKRQSRRRLRT